MGNQKHTKHETVDEQLKAMQDQRASWPAFLLAPTGGDKGIWETPMNSSNGNKEINKKK